MNPMDLCVFNKTSADGVLCTSKVERMIMDFKDACLKAYENFSVAKGRKNSYLGRLFDFCEEGKCKVSMNGNIEKLLNDEKVQGFAAFPATNELFTI